MCLLRSSLRTNRTPAAAPAQVLDAATTGSGHSKDEARQAAAGAMLRHPHFLAALPQHLGAGAVGARWAAAGQHHMAVPPHVPQLPANYKAALQEAVQKAGLAQLPQYTLLRSDGPPHMPNFTMQVGAAGAGAGRARSWVCLSCLSPSCVVRPPHQQRTLTVKSAVLSPPPSPRRWLCRQPT